MISANHIDLPIWLINLPRSDQRRKSMVSQLDKLQLGYEIFNAVDGRENWTSLEETVNIPAFERNTGRKVIPAEIGCYHSHLEVWKLLCASDAEIGLVLEDDVVFHDSFVTAVEAAITAADNWDILKLNFIRADWPIAKGKAVDWELYAYHGAFTGMGAYLIKRNIALKLLHSFLPITRPIDHELDRSHIYQIRHYGMVPYPSHVDDQNQSTITGRSFSSVHKFSPLRRLPNYFLRIRNLTGKLIYNYL